LKREDKMLSDATLIGIFIVGASAIVGIIGVFSNTQKHPGFKWALFFLLIAGAVAGINRAFQAEAAANAEKKRTEEALKLANESSRMVENGIIKQGEYKAEFNERREKLVADIDAQQKLLDSLMGQIIILYRRLEKISTSAGKAKKKEISEMGLDARLDASKTLLKLAREKQWLEGRALKKMESDVRKKTPLSGADLKKIASEMKRKHVGVSD
jgi:hypothetical protein